MTVKQRMPRRLKRLAKHIGMLRCEWCGRWVAVDRNYRWGSVSQWLEFAQKHPIWFCNRARCVANRAEFGVDDPEFYADPAAEMASED